MPRRDRAFNVPAKKVPKVSELHVVERGGGVEVDVRVVPRSSREAVVGEHDGALRIALTAPPVDGEANAALVAFVARALSVPKASVRIVRGERSKRKTLAIAGVDAAAVRALVPA